MSIRPANRAAWLAAVFVLVLAPRAGRADLIWDWSVDFAKGTESGVFVTEGSAAGGKGPGPGRYSVLDFEVRLSDQANPLGSLGDGTYVGSEPAFLYIDGRGPRIRDDIDSDVVDYTSPEQRSTYYSFFVCCGEGATAFVSGTTADGNGNLSFLFAGERSNGFVGRVSGDLVRVAAALDAARANAERGSDLAELISFLDGIASDAELATAIGELSPARLEGAGRATLPGTRNFHRQISRQVWRSGPHTSAARYSTLGEALYALTPLTASELRPALDDGEGLPDVGAPGRGGSALWRAFLETTAGYGSEDGHGGRVGQRYWSTGLVGGADLALAEDLVLGLSAGYGYADASERGATGSSNVHSARFSPYVGFANKRFRLDGAASFGLHWIDNGRKVLGTTSRSDHNAWDVAFFTTARHEIERGSFRFGPLASLQFIHLDEESYDDVGTGGGALRVGSHNTQSLASTLGAHVVWTAPLAERALSIDAEIGWVHEYLDDAQSFAARFAGDPSGFSVRLPDADRDALRLALAADLSLTERWNMRLGWEGTGSSHTEDHLATLRLETRF